MQLDHIVEKNVGKDRMLLILLFFPLSIFIFGIIAWILEGNFNISYILNGLKSIILTPTTLITDFLKVGGIAASLINVSLIGFYNLFLLKKYKLKINGLLIAAFFTVIGFSFFGKNLFNILPIYIGGYLYSKYQKIEFKDIILSVMFGTGLSPVVSQLSFSGIWPLYLSIPIGFMAGIFIGFVIVPLSTHMLKFHEGYNLYNIGFTSGILGTILTSILRSMNITVESANILYTSKNNLLLILLLIQFAYLIIIGIIINKRCIRMYPSIFKYKGRIVTDFTFLTGYGITFFNMGLLGFICLIYIIFVKGIINGPVLAAIFTVVGFGAFGKHLKNCMPVAFGVLIFALIFKSDLSSTGTIITMLFSTTIAPISGTFGPFVGIIAGMLHFTVASNIGIIHGGLNLYNNGFAGGIIAGFLVPVIEAFERGREKR